MVMCSNHKISHCLWNVLLSITVAACVSLIYVFVEIQNEHQAEVRRQTNGDQIQAEKFVDIDGTCVPVCNNKECVKYAKFLLRNMKPNADPCENIHTYACGTYEEQFSIEETRNMHYDTENNMYKIMDNILTNIDADPESASGKMKILYDSCMNYVASEKYGLPTAQAFLENIGISNWPHLASDFRFRETDIPTILGKLKAQGELIFLMFAVPPTEDFNYDYLQSNETYNMSVRADIRYFNNLLQLPPKASVRRILNYFDVDSQSMKEIWNDYKIIRNATLKLLQENCRDLIEEELYCHKAFQKEEKEACSVTKRACPDPYYVDKWYKEIKSPVCNESKLMCSDPKNDSTYMCKFIDVYLKNSGLIGMVNKDYIKIDAGEDHFVSRLIPTLNNFTERAVANFLALDFYLNHLGELNFYFQLTKKVYFPHKRCEIWRQPFVLDRWHVCTLWIIQNMHYAAVYEFQKNYLNLEENEKMISFFEESRSEVAELVSRQKWLSEQTKAEFKVTNVTVNLEFLKEYQLRPIKYEHSMNEHYKMFHPIKDNFFQNAQELRKAESDIHIMTSPINRYLYRMKFEKQATYICKTISYDFGKLVPPHYIPGLPRLLNLILFSVFAAHELGHHVDLTLKFKMKMDIETKMNIKDRDTCLIDQFSKLKYDFVDENVDGRQYIDENIADNFFTFVVDRLIEKYISTDEYISLPGFSSTNIKQELYIAINQLSCSKNSESEEAMYRKGLSHSPLKFRSLGPMQNSKGFSEAFNCSEGSFMNPTTKCSFLDWTDDV